VVFSDGLTTDRALEVQDYAGTRVRAAYGIGTHFTNDFANSPALNIVIKLHSINGRSVAKLSDEPTKASGDESAVREARRAVGFETSV
jgi:nicotinate phosphoribosyltransferase